jgi:2-keto-4-pentenoate hydratase/2-oxohepta-3-ene-1,7-dioic acid hydratase in catechol pathway
MRFVTFIANGIPSIGVQAGDDVIELSRPTPWSVGDALAAGVNLKAAGAAALAAHAPRHKMSSLVLAPVVPRPGKIICLGLNYYDHAKETGRQKPDYPWFFMRSATSLVAHGAPAWCPKASGKFDYEAELAVVIGRRSGRHVPQDDALDLVFGYACFNDMSVRDYQKRTPQWTIGKNFDRTGGFGPALVTADELPPGAAGLGIRSRLNGTVMQEATTADMLWGVAETIALLTECLTLEPGDVIAMGTPAGVGQSRTPPVWMRGGDRIEVEIDGVGLLVNDIVAEGT